MYFSRKTGLPFSSKLSVFSVWIKIPLTFIFFTVHGGSLLEKISSKKTTWSVPSGVLIIAKERLSLPKCKNVPMTKYLFKSYRSKGCMLSSTISASVFSVIDSFIMSGGSVKKSVPNPLPSSAAFT